MPDNPAMTEPTSPIPTPAAPAAQAAQPNTAADLSATADAATPPSDDPAPANPPSRGLWHSVALWRSLAIFFVIVMLLAGSAWLSMYEMMTTHINNLSKRLSDTPVVAHLAVLNNGQGEAGVLITYAPQKQQLRLQRVGSYQEADDRALHLWALPAQGAPRFLGVLGRGKLERLEVTEQDMKDVPTLAISLEAKNGPAADQPRGPVLFKGTLIHNQL